MMTPVPPGAGRRRLVVANPAAEGSLDAQGVLVVADGAEELALGDGGVPAVGPVAVAPLELAHRVSGVAQSVDEATGLVGLARQQPRPSVHQETSGIGSPDLRSKFVSHSTLRAAISNVPGSTLRGPRAKESSSSNPKVRPRRALGFPSESRS